MIFSVDFLGDRRRNETSVLFLVTKTVVSSHSSLAEELNKRERQGADSRGSIINVNHTRPDGFQLNYSDLLFDGRVVGARARVEISRVIAIMRPSRERKGKATVENCF